MDTNPVSAAVQRLMPWSSSPFAFLRFHHKTTWALSSFAVTAFLLYPWANQNYHKYLALGPGGMPYNIIGWALVTSMKPLEGETLSTEMYERDSDKSGWLRKGDGEGEIRLRNGTRPTTGWHCIPHRQLDQIPGEDVKELLEREFYSVAAANAHIVEVKLSAHEKRGDSLSIHSSIPSPHKVASDALREIAHVHAKKDSSMHVVLSPQDCKLVIEQGWGERHPLSGQIYIPKEYLLIYAPQAPEDVRIHASIMRAAISYMTGKEAVH